MRTVAAGSSQQANHLDPRSYSPLPNPRRSKRNPCSRSKAAAGAPAADRSTRGQGRDRGMAEAFDMYRQSVIGYALIETLDEMVGSGALSPELAMAVVMQFDKSMCHALDKHVESRAFFKGGNLRTYRYCDNMWTLILRNTTFKNEEIETVLPKVKIVACDMRIIGEPAEPITCQQCQ